MTDGSLHDLITTVGIDLGKNVFHLIGMDRYGKILRRQKLARGQPEERLAGRPPRLIGPGACAGAHHVGRRLAALGREVRLVPAQYVKPFSKGQKNDYRDAEATAKALRRPTTRFVPLKGSEQLELHRTKVRELERLSPVPEAHGGQTLTFPGTTLRWPGRSSRRRAYSRTDRPRTSRPQSILPLTKVGSDDIKYG